MGQMFKNLRLSPGWRDLRSSLKFKGLEIGAIESPDFEASSLKIPESDSWIIYPFKKTCPLSN